MPTIIKLFGRVLETTVQDDPRMKGITSISPGEVPRTTPARSRLSKHVTALQQSAQNPRFLCRASPAAAMALKIVEAVKAFQKRHGLKVDGVAGSQVIQKAVW